MKDSVELVPRGSCLGVWPYLAFVLGVWFSPVQSKAVELFENHSNARAMGLGGAYSALVNDAESLFYNPAGIARNGGIFWTIADPKFGATDLAGAMDVYTDLKSAATFPAALNSLYNDPVWVGGSAKSAIIVPYFAAAYFYDVDASFLAQNPVSPTLTTNYITDSGVAIGSAFSIAGVFELGFSAKHITRVGDRKDWGAQTLAEIAAGTLAPTYIFDSLAATKGVGYAFDVGMNISVPVLVQPTFSFVWKNVGDTKFRAKTGVTAPPTDYQDMTVGAALHFDAWLMHISPVVEVKHLNAGDMQIGQKIHMGVEVGIPFVDLRVGLHQGYYSAGIGIDMGLIKIDAATWGAELGGYPGQLESRRYMIQAILEIGFDFGFGSGRGARGGLFGGDKGAGASGAAGGGSGSRNGRGRFKNVKQRR